MKNCSCEKCLENLQNFEPTRDFVNIAKSEAVKSLGEYLFKLEINKHTSLETPPYDPFNLAQVLMTNILETNYEDLLSFKEYLEVFSLGLNLTESIYNFVVSNHTDMLSLNVVLDVSENFQQLDFYNSESDSTDSSCEKRDYACINIYYHYLIGSHLFRKG